MENSSFHYSWSFYHKFAVQEISRLFSHKFCCKNVLKSRIVLEMLNAEFDEFAMSKTTVFIMFVEELNMWSAL